MDELTLPLDLIRSNKMSVNEYLVLYDIVHGYPIGDLIDNPLPTLVSLEGKGFVKLTNNQVYLREKGSELFNADEDYFAIWLETYPTMVKKHHGGKRALSPSKPNTILGKALRKKWNSVFKKDIKAQEKAILVLQQEVKDKTKNGNLEYMVEARRWLNEGYHEKYSFLVDDGIVPENKYSNEDYM
jgi:hypothetical protein